MRILFQFWFKLILSYSESTARFNLSLDESSGEASLQNSRVTLINGYGPQETQSAHIREAFFTYLDLVIKKAKAAGTLVCVEMDSNSKLGPGLIPGDPHEQSENGY